MKYLKLMRVHHYIKNLLIFSALFFSKNLFDLDKTLSCILAFISFSLMTSVVYIINDVKDVDNDLKHPVKCKRPIASKSISIKNANVLIVLLFILSICINLLIFNFEATLLLALYFIINLLYSFKLKDIAFIDVLIISLGYVIRVLYGALIINIEVSTYLYLIILFISLYFAFGKRRSELKNIKSVRKSLNYYSINILNFVINLLLLLTNVVYIIWTLSESTRNLYDNDILWITSLMVALITMKYHFNLNDSIDGDPIPILLNDKILILFCIVYCSIMTLLLYI